jgi:hypothetical protein
MVRAALRSAPIGLLALVGALFFSAGAASAQGSLVIDVPNGQVWWNDGDFITTAFTPGSTITAGYVLMGCLDDNSNDAGTETFEVAICTNSGGTTVLASAQITNNFRNTGGCDSHRYSFDFPNVALTGGTTYYLRTKVLAGAPVRSWGGDYLFYNDGYPTDVSRTVVDVPNGHVYWANGDFITTAFSLASGGTANYVMMACLDDNISDAGTETFEVALTTDSGGGNVLSSAQITNNFRNTGGCDEHMYLFDLSDVALSAGTTYYLRTKVLAGAEVRTWAGDYLYYTPSASPVCTVNPTALDFGAVEIGSYADRTFSITNTGAGTLSGSVVESCDHYSLVSGGGSYNLTAGQSVTVTVRFSPTTAGTHLCNVDTGAGCTTDVACTGLGGGGADWCSYDHRYAIVVMGGDVSGQSYLWFWGDTSGMYRELLSYGFTADNVRFLSYGDSATVHPDWVDGVSTTANIIAAYQWAQSVCLAGDLLYIYWVDHGSPTAFETHDGTITHVQLGSLTGSITAKQIIGAYNPCYSGGVVDDISRLGVITTTSQDATHANSWGWAGMWRRALRGAPEDGVDSNGDGRVSMTEAYNWIAPQSQAAGEHPLFDDNGDQVGHEFGTAGYDPTTSGFDGYIGNTYALSGWLCAVDAVPGPDGGEFANGLEQAILDFPNPFRPNAPITYSLPWSVPVQVAIYDLNGHRVWTLANSEEKAGRHSLMWDGRNSSGQAVSSGIYLIRLEARGKARSWKMMLLH